MFWLVFNWRDQLTQLDMGTTMKRHIARAKKHWEDNALTYFAGLGWTVVPLTLTGVVLFGGVR